MARCSSRASVRLTGAVANAALRDMADADAWRVFGVDTVINDITLLP
jgi:osmotically-inducible protein OsmY